MRPDLERVARRVHDDLLAATGASVDERSVAALVHASEPLLAPSSARHVIDAVLARAAGLGVLEPLLADDRVTDVLVNGPGEVWVERSGELERTGVCIDRRALDVVIERVVAPLDLRADRTQPVVDARLPDGSRAHVVMPPLAVDGPYLTIRRFSRRVLPVGDFCSQPVASLLRRLVERRWNIVVSGGTGAGKTTLLNAIAAWLPADARLVTIEDAAELRLPSPHVVRLEARAATADGAPATTIRDLVRTALRMRPDRIIVGEVRGPEALDMLQAMNTGHEGSLTTCHANSPGDALRRLETMAMSSELALPLVVIREHLAASIDAVIHVARGRDGQRRIVAVDEVATDPDAQVRTRSLVGVDGEVREPSRPARVER